MCTKRFYAGILTLLLWDGNVVSVYVYVILCFKVVQFVRITLRDDRIRQFIDSSVQFVEHPLLMLCTTPPPWIKQILKMCDVSGGVGESMDLVNRTIGKLVPVP